MNKEDLERIEKQLEREAFLSWYCKMTESDRLNIMEDYWKANRKTIARQAR